LVSLAASRDFGLRLGVVCVGPILRGSFLNDVLAPDVEPAQLHQVI
jgi:hypothetical protein